MSKKLKHSIYLFITLIVLNIVSQGYYNRIDLTTDNRYTLAKVTKDIIANIDKQLIVKVYLEGDFPSEFKRLQIETRQFLEELNAKNSFIKIQFIRPNNQRERLIKVGMIPSQLTVKEDGKLSNAIIFPWAEIVYKKKTNIVSLLPNGTAQSQEDQLETAVENLEFSFSNAIYKLQEEKQKKVAVLSGNEELLDIQLYSFLSEVTKKHRLAKFTLDSVASNSVKSLKDLQQFDLAIIAKPTESFTEKEKLVLDQYIMNGGKTLWMLENVQADTDSLFKDGKMLAYPRDLNLTDFFFSYGLRVNVTLIQDLYAAKIPLATGNIGNKPQFQNLNWFYHPLVSGNQTHAISKNIAPVRLRFANQIDTLQNSLQKTVLLMSSMLTRKTGTPAIIALESIAEEPKEEDYSSGFQIFSLLIEGDFTSMYANRIKPFNIKKFSKKSSHNKMIVISDGDIGRNQLQKGKPFDLAQDKWTGEQFGNKEFLLNAVDYLLDDNGLIELRNKNVQINLLDKERAYQERIFWQFVNIVLPLLVLLTFGFVFQYVRKRTYS
ncbi:gliding motility-associated ABC transporter substrate-binding protein GldG [bacterium]|jgi:gliding-associated putative ABC transporter substrate-binding component GldG|nr:gliding motility-associated ABC transporter substrate-binding protein GldG [bacterium]MDA9338149.1 gliding motility-associated ABC transporter substrate-binding protein GldG [Flavobacteriaceae bacterium]MDB9928093.1 gliding motility-associated ABC transporter substrate-binding protein GldG [Flavobacteriaceae bacterium]MDB9956217.1 gliding motility-associated ABC transporter substrate-binding protein GldG [Flavobacteriaceae bacterium]|tara:strand:+ start:1265 stop:2905 length:1641 start_codon:yes stop_codon:yes gene_type:complete